MAIEIKPDKIVDARNILCPGPFWELIKAYHSAGTNEVVSIYSSDEYDSETKIDAPVWINKSGNRLIGVFDREGYYEIVMEKTRPTPHSS